MTEVCLRPAPHGRSILRWVPDIVGDARLHESASQCGLQTQAQLYRGALKRYLFIRKRLIFESSVRAGRPSLAAAPDVPEI
jgi:hypothetical protein